MQESITTSHAKAKAIKSDADKLITKAKKGGLHAFRMLQPDLSTVAVKKLIETIAPRFTKRQGGYTRIIKLGARVKDHAPEAIIEWTELSKGLATVGSAAVSVKPAASAKTKIEKVVKKEKKGKTK